jgi:DNA sulfur modification protein DndD
MKYQKLKVENWRPFHGSHELVFSVDSQKPVTLVFGKNGGGKTSLIAAMYWCLYGNTNVDPNTPDETSMLFNQRAVAQMETHDKATMEVELEISQGDALWRIRRSVTASMSSYGTPKFSKPELVATRIRDNVPEEFKGEEANFKITEILDPNLGEFFFHAAETLAFPFDHSKKARDKLRDVLFIMVGQIELENFVAQATEAEKKLNIAEKNLRKNAKAGEELTVRITDVEEKIYIKDEAIQEWLKNIDGYDKAISLMTKRLKEVDHFAPAIKELEDAKLNQKQYDSAKNRADIAVKKNSSDLWKLQAEKIVTAYSEWFEPQSKKFPLVINKNTISHIKESGKCICGREAGHREIEAIERQLEASGGDEAARRLTELYNLAGNWESDARRIRKEFEGQRVDQAKAVEALEMADGLVVTALENLANLGTKPGEDPEQLRANLLATTKKRDKENILYEQCLNVDKPALVQDRASLMRQSQGNLEPKLLEARARARGAELACELVERMKEKHAELARPELERQMNENYWVFKDDRKISIDEDWYVSTYDETRNGPMDAIAGGGAETTLLTYAFAAAAAKLIPSFAGLPDSYFPDAENLAETETYPLAVDAPFSSLGDDYQKEIALRLPLAVDQLILFNEATHMKRFELMEEAGQIGEIYSVLYEGPLKNHGGENVQSTFEFADNEITYVVHNAEQIGSSIQRHQARS